MIIDLCSGKNCLKRNTCGRFKDDPTETINNPHKGKKFRLSPTLQLSEELECSKYSPMSTKVKFHAPNNKN
jgi:hypothetical protein